MREITRNDFWSRKRCWDEVWVGMSMGKCWVYAQEVVLFVGWSLEDKSRLSIC